MEVIFVFFLGNIDPIFDECDEIFMIGPFFLLLTIYWCHPFNIDLLDFLLKPFIMQQVRPLLIPPFNKNLKFIIIEVELKLRKYINLTMSYIGYRVIRLRNIKLQFVNIACFWTLFWHYSLLLF